MNRIMWEDDQKLVDAATKIAVQRVRETYRAGSREVFWMSAFREGAATRVVVDVDGESYSVIVQDIEVRPQTLELVAFGSIAPNQCVLPQPVPPSTLIRCPGGACRSVAEFLFSPRTFEGVFEPLLADLAHEWMQALIADRPWKARWIRVRYTAIFFGHLFAQLPLGVMKALIALWKSAS